VVAGVGANVATCSPSATCRQHDQDWLSYGIDGLNPFMNVQSHGRAQQNLAVSMKSSATSAGYSSLPERTPGRRSRPASRPSTDHRPQRRLRLNLLDSPFAEQDLNHVGKLQISVEDGQDDVHSIRPWRSAAPARQVARSPRLIYDDLEDDEVSQWVHRVKRLSELGLEEEASELEQSLIELTRNDPELQTEFLKR
jgi:hypothetical protein